MKTGTFLQLSCRRASCQKEIVTLFLSEAEDDDFWKTQIRDEGMRYVPSTKVYFDSGAEVG
jgi:hypothetical protein